MFFFRKHLLVLTALLMTAAGAAQAQAYPTRPIRVVVPYPPGGATDIVAREISQQVAIANGWTLIIDNRAGAGGTLGVDIVAKSPADGYTVLLGQTSNLAIGPSLYEKLPYDPRKDLEPIAHVGKTSMVIVASATSPFAGMADLIATARRKPETVSFASSGNGSIGHLAGQQFQSAANVKLQHIPYKGATQAVTDVISGTVDVYFAGVPAVLQQIRGGKMRALAVTSATRVSDLPDTPTLSEGGLKGFDAVAWYGFLAPAGTPRDVVAKLNTAINQALQQPELRGRLRAEGVSVTGGTPVQFAELIREDIGRWGKIVKASGAKVD